LWPVGVTDTHALFAAKSANAIDKAAEAEKGLLGDASESCGDLLMRLGSTSLGMWTTWTPMLFMTIFNNYDQIIDSMYLPQIACL